MSRKFIIRVVEEEEYQYTYNGNTETRSRDVPMYAQTVFRDTDIEADKLVSDIAAIVNGIKDAK